MSSIEIDEIEVATEAFETNVPSTNFDKKILAQESGKKSTKKSKKGKFFSSIRKKLKGDSNENSSGGGTDPKLVNEKKASMFSKIFYGSNGKKFTYMLLITNALNWLFFSFYIAGLSEEEVKATLENVADCFSIKMQYRLFISCVES